jgi:hypothetical protein
MRYAPTTSCFIDEDTQVVASKYNFTKLIGTPIPRDTSKKQIEVLVYNLRCRKEPNGTILGYTTMGIYNILEMQKGLIYTWYKIDNDKWIAYSPNWATIYDDLELENALLKAENAQLKQELASYVKIENAYIKK